MKNTIKPLVGRLAIGACLLALCSATPAATYTNPRIPGGIGNDPDVSLIDGQYHMIVGNPAGYYAYRTSQNLITWSASTQIFQQTGGYTLWEGHQVKEATTGDIWMYYTLVDPDGQHKRVKVAKAASPGTVSAWTTYAFEIDNAIDPYLFKDGNNMYLYYKKTTDMTLRARKMTWYNDIDESVTEQTLLVPWNDPPDDCGNPPFKTIEGPCVQKFSGKYFLIFSAGAWDQNCYSLCFAYSSNPLGPFTRGDWSSDPSANCYPFMSIAESPTCPSIGAASVVLDGNNQPWICYRQWATPGNGTRDFCIEPLNTANAANGRINSVASRSPTAKTVPVPLP